MVQSLPGTREISDSIWCKVNQVQERSVTLYGAKLTRFKRDRWLYMLQTVEGETG